MLVELRIQNLVLVDDAVIPFTKGLNILSGETGSGKSVVISALALLFGKRADSKVIRKGALKGSVEAVCDFSLNTSLIEYLQTCGIEQEKGDDFIIRREINSEGRSRSWINHQPVQQKFLREIGERLALFVGQHGSRALMDPAFPRDLVDQFGGHEELAISFRKSFEHSQLLRRNIEELKNQETKRCREMEVCKREIEEISQANLQEEEDDALFIEYSERSGSQEKCAIMDEIMKSLEDQSIPSLNHTQKEFERLITLDSDLEEQGRALKSAICDLQEIAYTLTQKMGKIEEDPYRLEEINKRLALLEDLKKKYGPSLANVITYHNEANQRLARLEECNLTIEDLQKELVVEDGRSNHFAEKLSRKRESTSRQLKKLLTESLKDLNLPQVEVDIQITKKERSSVGDESLELFFAPNEGEKKVSIQSCASGGELSRLLLVIYSLLAGKEKTPLLVFDEVDANIGGQTALSVGQRLKSLGQVHQVLCITHFPQVAQFADHHVQIVKKNIEGRTRTEMIILDKVERSDELLRMVGGDASNTRLLLKEAKG